MSEQSEKEHIIRNLMAEHEVDALLLRKVSSFAWAACGAASYVSTAVENGEASLLFTPDSRYIITNNIEALRLRDQDEEHLRENGWEFAVNDWWTTDDPLATLVAGKKLASDGPRPDALDLSTEIAHLRANLSNEEIIRFREVGRLCSQAMSAIIPIIKPGMAEHEIGGVLMKELQSLGVNPIVIQVATDERAAAIRHAIPSEKKLAHYAIISLCGRKNGLVASMSRSLYFGAVPSDLAQKHHAAASVDAAMIAATRPGRKLREVLATAQQAYTESGYPDEWKKHHQGGAAGFEPREYLGSPTATETIKSGQAFAWNPSITGTKSEDTILINKDENEILTETKGWPTLAINMEGQTILRPSIMEL